MSNFIEFSNVSKVYTIGTSKINALDGISFAINKGEFVVILGPSGSGKTTLLNLLGGMDKLSSGDIFVDTSCLSQFGSRQMTYYRRHNVGFVFQFYNLMPNLTARENIELATEICNNALPTDDILDKVMLLDRAKNFPSQLSVGEQQRVSIARAVAKNPKLLLCDEPTGALDYETGKVILKLLHDICKTQNKTVILVTHNVALKEMADKVISIKNGKVTNVFINPTPQDISDIEW